MLPFIAGAVVGIVGVVAVQKRKTIVEKITSATKDAKESIVETSKEVKSKIHEMTAKDEASSNTVEKENSIKESK
jgi:hypothetical protein